MSWGENNGKEMMDIDASGKDEEVDVFSRSFHEEDNGEESGGKELSRILLPRRQTIASERLTSGGQPPVSRIGTVANLAMGSSKRMQRANNYKRRNLLLTKAYVSISSNDPMINGSQQRVNLFWAKVHEKYKVLVSQQVPKVWFVGCPVESLKQRYLKVIAKAVGKFNKFYCLLKKRDKKKKVSHSNSLFV